MPANDGTQDLKESYGSDPTTQTTKLEKQLFIELDNFYRFGSDDDIDISTAINRIMPLIQSEASRIALEARIDELERLSHTKFSEIAYNIPGYLSDRIASLTAPEGGKHES